MAYKVLETALTTTTEALYMFVADNEQDIPNLPNMEQTGSETNTRWYAKAGSVVRVVATGRFYTLAPSNKWKALYYMREELEDAIDHNITIMQQILAEAKVSAETTANNASAAAKSERNASASASRASESANKAAESQKNAEAARTAAEEAAIKAGADVVSPTVTTAQTDTGVTITITDAAGTHTVTLTNGANGDKGDKGDPGMKGDKGDTGAKGADGKTPVKGTDYWTEADKTAIVADVIAALPAAEGMSV